MRRWSVDVCRMLCIGGEVWLHPFACMLRQWCAPDATASLLLHVVIYRQIWLAESIRLLKVETVRTSNCLLATLTDKLKEGEDRGECVESAVYCGEDPTHVLAICFRH